VINVKAQAKAHNYETPLSPPSPLLALVADTARFQRPTKPKESGVTDQDSSTIFLLIIKQKPRMNPQLNK